MYLVQDAHSFWNWVYFVLLIVVSIHSNGWFLSTSWSANVISLLLIHTLRSTRFTLRSQHCSCLNLIVMKLALLNNVIYTLMVRMIRTILYDIGFVANMLLEAYVIKMVTRIRFSYWLLW